MTTGSVTYCKTLDRGLLYEYGVEAHIIYFIMINWLIFPAVKYHYHGSGKAVM